MGVLLMIGGAGHVIDAGTELLFPGIVTIRQFTFAFAMIAGLVELLFASWLLIKGLNVERWQQVTLA